MSNFRIGLAVLAVSLALFSVTTGSLAAQATGTIRGTVVDASTRAPLAGAQIQIPGTQIRSVTSAAGAYQLSNVPARTSQIRATMIGHSSVTRSVAVTAGQIATVNFELAPAAITLDELVVTGAGVATEKRKLGNTVATVSAEQLENKPIQTFSEVLQGREPGVVGLPSGGLTGEGTRIRIRGTNSLSQSNEPIVYLNGIRIDNGGGRGYIGTGGGGLPSRLDDIDPNSIERIEILKGAAAATLYGSEASSGVIQVFTKKGGAGPPRWTFQVEQGMLKYPNAFAPNAGFVTSDTAAARLSEFYGTSIRPFEPFSRGFVGELVERGYASSYFGSVSGGSPGMTYFASGRYQFEDGPVGAEDIALANDKASKAQGNLGLSVFPFEGLQLRLNSMYTQSNSNTINNNNNIYAPFTLAMFGQPQRASCVTNRGRSDPDPGTGRCTGVGNPMGNAAFATVRESLQREVEQEAQHFNGSLSANYRPLEGITLDVTFGTDIVNQQDVAFRAFGHDVDLFTSNNIQGDRTVSNRNFRQLSLNTQLSWATDLTSAISSQFVGGAQGGIKRTTFTGGFGRDFPGPGFEIAQAGSYQETYETFQSVSNVGLLAQEQLGWNDWVFLTLGARYDYSSAFGESAGGALYPKVSISLSPSSRPGWASDLLSTVRVRAAWGQSGLQPGFFDKFTTFGSIRSEFGPGVRPSNLGNPELKPEVSTELELGTELGLFKDRFGLEGTYFNRTTTDALISRQFPVSGGFLNRQLTNIGELAAQGVERGAKGVVFQRGTFAVNLFANASYLWEKIEDMGGAPALKVGGSYTRYRNWIREGYSPGAFFGPRVRTDVEYPLDTNGDCQPDSREQLLQFFSQPRSVTSSLSNPRVLVQNGDPRPCGGGGDFLGLYLGKPTPDWSGSFGGAIDFLRNFQISSLFEYKAGNFQVHNLTDEFRHAHASLGGNHPDAVRVRAIMASPTATPEERLEAAKEWALRYVGLSPYDGLNHIEDADFVRWRELSLTYEASQQWARRVGMQTLALTLSGRNLAIWTKYSGTDPEVNLLGRTTGGGLDDFAQGIDAFGFPLPRRYSVSVRVGF